MRYIHIIYIYAYTYFLVSICIFRNWVLEMGGNDGCPENMGIFNTTKLDTQKWLRRYVLSHVYFNHNFKIDIHFCLSEFMCYLWYPQRKKTDNKIIAVHHNIIQNQFYIEKNIFCNYIKHEK
jgi:hypothetical protein